MLSLQHLVEILHTVWGESAAAFLSVCQRAFSVFPLLYHHNAADIIVIIPLEAESKSITIGRTGNVDGMLLKSKVWGTVSCLDFRLSTSKICHFSVQTFNIHCALWCLLCVRAFPCCLCPCPRTPLCLSLPLLCSFHLQIKQPTTPVLSSTVTPHPPILVVTSVRRQAPPWRKYSSAPLLPSLSSCACLLMKWLTCLLRPMTW